MDEKIKLLVNTLGPERVKLNEKLSHYTFSKLGGPAQAFYIATSQIELINILNLADSLALPMFVFGSGTKLVISDKGMGGLVIKNRSGSLKIGGIKGKVKRGGLGIEEALIEVDSGVTLSKLNEFLGEQHLKHFQGISSQHATIGGAIFIDSTLREMVKEVKVWEKGMVFGIEVASLARGRHVVVSCIIKAKAKEVV